MDDDLGCLGQIPLQVTSKARAVADHAEQNRRHPFGAGGENLPRAMVTIIVEQYAVNRILVLMRSSGICGAATRRTGACGTSGSLYSA